MFLYGASGHAKVIVDILQKNGVEINGLFDDDPEIKTLGEIICYGKFDLNVIKGNKLIISIGNNTTRKNIVENITNKVLYGNAIDISSIISKSVILKNGIVIMPNAVINADSIIGNHAIINTSASIDHECIIEDFVHISPNATLCGNVYIGESSHIGAGATIIPNIKIGKNVIVGAGSVVTKDIPDNYTAVGIPARKIKRNEK